MERDTLRSGARSLFQVLLLSMAMGLADHSVGQTPPGGGRGPIGPPALALTCTGDTPYLVIAGGALACRPRFVDNGDQTVTDNKTGLMWEKKEGCGSADFLNPRCVENTYTWSAASPFTDPTGTLFSDFLERLNDLKTTNDGTATPCFANHCDWRIPTIGELRSILSAQYPLCTAAPCIDQSFGPTQEPYYWSSSSYASAPNFVWLVGFHDGGVGFSSKNSAFSARAVRGGR
jgi:Protein of unknown function (DUF1566)